MVGRKFFIFTFLGMFFLACSSNLFAEYKECQEVAKGKIPIKFLDKSLKQLPSGIGIWDLEEAVSAIKEKKAKRLWVDTRPGVFIKKGTINTAVQLVCDLKGIAIPDSDAANAISKDRLITAMKKVDQDIDSVQVVYFCQGPK